jgi:hypothetical protein
MSYIPANAKWYLADIVEQIVVEGDPRNIVHTNLVLVRADTPEDAFARANELGTAAQASYENPEGKIVTITYRGLRDLTVIHGEFEHGAELTYSEEIDVDETAIQQCISSKEELGVFAPIMPSRGPNYSSKDVIDELHTKFPDLSWGEEGDTKA